jgi:hypothetical protein
MTLRSPWLATRDLLTGKLGVSEDKLCEAAPFLEPVRLVAPDEQRYLRAEAVKVAMYEVHTFHASTNGRIKKREFVARLDEICRWRNSYGDPTLRSLWDRAFRREVEDLIDEMGIIMR